MQPPLRPRDGHAPRRVLVRLLYRGPRPSRGSGVSGLLGGLRCRSLRRAPALVGPMVAHPAHMSRLAGDRRADVQLVLRARLGARPAVEGAADRFAVLQRVGRPGLQLPLLLPSWGPRRPRWRGGRGRRESGPRLRGVGRLPHDLPLLQPLFNNLAQGEARMAVAVRPPLPLVLVAMLEPLQSSPRRGLGGALHESLVVCTDHIQRHLRKDRACEAAGTAALGTGSGQPRERTAAAQQPTAPTPSPKDAGLTIPPRVPRGRPTPPSNNARALPAPAHSRWMPQRLPRALTALVRPGWRLRDVPGSAGQGPGRSRGTCTPARAYAIISV